MHDAADLDIGMKAAKEDLLSVPHFACFGGIVFAFARLEYLIQVTWGQANVEHLKILVLTKSLSYSQKRDTLYSYFKNFKLANPHHEIENKKIIDRADVYNSLRNNIAHVLWREGTRPDSIRAGHIDVRRGKGKIAGYSDEEKDYTLSELAAIANELRGITNALIRYLRDSGISSDVAARIEQVNE